ncbi:MAG: hypothetical protein QOE14_492, partial [Humisphaera sp.]|nr:hypothetical protein [Humisphaera sp.]
MMHRATDASTPAHGSSPAPSPSSNAGASSSPQPLDGLNNDGHVCPFCGLTRDITEDFDPSAPCPRCTLADTPTTRNATKARIGPWHVRQMRNPWAPGMRWETLLALIKRGQVTKDSVVRGPTTHQLWKRASEIKGLSREFAVCYSCGGDIDTQANLCGHCNRLQEPPANPNVLVETREVGNQPPVADAATTPSPPTPQPQAPSKAAAPSPVASRPNCKAPGRHEEADDAPAHLDIGSATPPVTDPHEMLTVDNPESAAAVARSAAARGKGRPARPAGPTATPPPTPAASTLPSPSRPLQLRKRQPGSEDALLTPQEL